MSHISEDKLNNCGGSMRIWGRMTIHGVGSMVRIPKHVDKHLYKQILAEALPETMSTYGMEAKMPHSDMTMIQNTRQKQ
jgi:hypothetical protein